MTRAEFREAVFARDNHSCVICRAAGQDAHHILERRLFSAPAELGGYFLSNGATLCTVHHLQAEETTLSCEEVRLAAGITRTILPSYLYDDVRYDKWGNQIEPNGTRLRGELFYDESVQKILAQGGARVKALHAQIRHDFPAGWRLCGENLYAKHSIFYNTLPSYFLLFSIWNERNECLSWNETEDWAEMLNLTLVPVLYRGVWDEKRIQTLYQPRYEGSEMEGYVVRLARRFSYGEFRRSTAKFVRPNFAAGRHNYHRVLELNGLASEAPDRPDEGA